MAWASGQKLQGSKYTIEQELGLGGFGITYLATDNNGRQVVIKTLNDKVQRRSDGGSQQQLVAPRCQADKYHVALW